MFYLYILKSKLDNRIYIGYTDNLRRRFSEHNSGKNIATKNHLPWELIYYEAYKAKTDAKYRESNLKRFAQAYTALRQRVRNSLI